MWGTVSFGEFFIPHARLRVLRGYVPIELLNSPYSNPLPPLLSFAPPLYHLPDATPLPFTSSFSMTGSLTDTQTTLIRRRQIRMALQALHPLRTNGLDLLSEILAIRRRIYECPGSVSSPPSFSPRPSPRNGPCINPSPSLHRHLLIDSLANIPR
jgi:hypothetical protein